MIAVFDLDGTLTRRDTFFPFVIGLLARHPARWPRVLWLPFLAAGYLLGRLDRGGLKGAILNRLFGGMPRSVLANRAELYAASVVPERMFAEAVQAFQKHLAAGDHVVVLSASPDVFVPAIARRLGAREVICTELRWEGERFDGRLAGPNRRDHEKARVVAGLRARMPGQPVIAYGNSSPDLVHMLQCEQAVYVNPDAALEQQLVQKGLSCVHWR